MKTLADELFVTQRVDLDTLGWFEMRLAALSMHTPSVTATLGA